MENLRYRKRSGALRTIHETNPFPFACAQAFPPKVLSYKLTACPPGSGYLAHHVLRAERIGHAHGALRVIAPLPIHQKSVVVRSWGQVHRRGPHASFSFLHWNGGLLPLRKIAGQQNARRIRRGVTEGLFAQMLGITF